MTHIDLRSVPNEPITREQVSGTKVTIGTVIRPFEAVTALGQPVRVPEPTGLTHLQFRRFAGCPVCNLHLRGIARRHAEIVSAGVREVAVFHSTGQSLRPYVGALPFAVVGDPDRRLYTRFGLQASARAVLDPRAWGAMTRGSVADLVHVARGRQPVPHSLRDGGGLGLPADLLLAPDGEVLAVKYGAHANDQWSVDEILAHARNARRSAS